MFKTLLLVGLLVFTFVGCSRTDITNQHEITSQHEINEEVNNSDSEKTNELTDLTTVHATLYDPATIKINDYIGKMKVTSITITEQVSGQPIIDIMFESEKIELTGTFQNLKASGYDTDVILFIPDETSSKLIPSHNLFEHDIRLYFVEIEQVEMFQGYTHGTAHIVIEGYYDYVHYKDEIIQNTSVIEVIQLNS